jgi:hypothetical protein
MFGLCLGQYGSVDAVHRDPQAARRTQPRYEPVSDGEIIARLRRAASDGDLGADDQSGSMLAGCQPKLLLARFGISGTCPGAARIPPTSSSRDWRDAPTGSRGSTTGTRPAEAVVRDVVTRIAELRPDAYGAWGDMEPEDRAAQLTAALRPTASAPARSGAPPQMARARTDGV